MKLRQAAYLTAACATIGGAVALSRHHADDFHDRFERRASAALEIAGHSWARLEADGEAIALTGIAPDAAASAAAEALIAESGWGISVVNRAVVENNPLDAPPRYSIRVHKDPGGAQIIGVAPSEYATDAINRRVAARLEGMEIAKLTRSADGDPDPDWEQAARAAIDALPYLSQGEVAADSDGVRVQGVAPDSDARDAARAAVLHMAPAGVDVRIDLETPTSKISPYPFQARKTADGAMRVTGAMPDAETAETFLARAGALLPERLQADIETGAGAPDADWTYAALGGLLALDQLESGAFVMTGRDASLEGVGDASRSAQARILFAELPQAYTRSFRAGPAQPVAVSQSDAAPQDAAETASAAPEAPNAAESPQADAAAVMSRRADPPEGREPGEASPEEMRPEASSLDQTSPPPGEQTGTEAEIEPQNAPQDAVGASVDAAPPIADTYQAIIAAARAPVSPEAVAQAATRIQQATQAPEQISDRTSDQAGGRAPDQAPNSALTGAPPSTSPAPAPAQTTPQPAPAANPSQAVSAPQDPVLEAGAPETTTQVEPPVSENGASQHDAPPSGPGAWSPQVVEAPAPPALRPASVSNVSGPAAAPAVWFSVSMTPDGRAALTGSPPDAQTRQALAGWAAASFGADMYDDRMIVAEGDAAENDWTQIAFDLMDVMKTLLEGETRLSDGVIFMRGVTVEEGGRAAVAAALADLRPTGYIVRDQITERTPEEQAPRSAAAGMSPAECGRLLDASMLRAPIDFPPGQTEMTRQSAERVEYLALILKNCDNAIIEVGGHTDSSGAARSNQRLSQQRAGAVRDKLVQMGVPPSALTVRGYGEARPIADNSTRAGRAQNRRIEFKVTAADD